jgi:hypothetical protein
VWCSNVSFTGGFTPRTDDTLSKPSVYCSVHCSVHSSVHCSILSSCQSASRNSLWSELHHQTSVSRPWCLKKKRRRIGMNKIQRFHVTPPLEPVLCTAGCFHNS